MGGCQTLVRVPAFSLWDLRVRQWKRKSREALFNYFTPAGPVYAFLANLYWGPADVGRRTVCTILSPAFLCLSASPLRTCSLKSLCVWLACWLAWARAKEMCGQNANLVWLFGGIKACEGVCVCVKDCSRVWGHQGQDHYNCFRKITFNCRERTPSRCTFFLLCLSYCGLFGSPGLRLCLMDKRSKHKWGNDKQTLSSFSGRCERMMSVGYRRETFGKNTKKEADKHATERVKRDRHHKWRGHCDMSGKREVFILALVKGVHLLAVLFKTINE